MPSESPTEAWAGDSLLRFDGAVLEVFGYPGAYSIRFHLRNLDLDVDEPDGKGRRLVTLKPATRGNACALQIDEADWAQAGPLIDRVYEAIPDPG